MKKNFAGCGYGDFKKTVAETVIEELRPIQEKYKELINNPDYLEKIYKNGAEKAYSIAHKTLEDVYKKIGMVWN